MNQYERALSARLVLSVVATGIMSFSGVVVETAMNVTFPALMAEFGVGTSTVQWITTGYLLVLSAIIPASAWLQRRFTTRTLFTAAVALFAAGTLLAAFSPAFSFLLAGRLVQGVGTGIALPLMFNIVLEQAPFDRMGLMMGVASLITAIAPAIGPSVGGLIVEQFGWRTIFIALLPLLACSFAMGVCSIRQTRETERTPFRTVDWLVLAAAFSCFVFATSGASDAGWLSVRTGALLAATAALLAVFVVRSAHADRPLVRVEVFRCRAFCASLGAIVLIQFICLGLGYLIPNFAQMSLGQNAFVAGCLLLPGCALAAVMTPFSGRLLDRLGARPPIIAGCVSIVACTALFSLLAPRLSPALIAVVYLLFSFGQGAAFGNTMTNGIRQLPEPLSADGNAVVNTFQQLAGALGTSVVSTVVATAQAGATDLAAATADGTAQSFLLLCALALCALGCSLAALFGRRRRTPRRGREANAAAAR